MINGIYNIGYSNNYTPGSYGNSELGVNASGKTIFSDKADTTGKMGATGKADPSAECQTCASRKYQDGSNENVSFKAPTHISPEAAGSAVRAHEGEHVSNAYTKAAQDNGKVLNASVRIHTSVCPECGKTYVSGGVTNTTIKYSNEDNPYVKNLKAQQGELLKGQFIDFAA